MRRVEKCPVCGGGDFRPFAMVSTAALLHTAQVRCRCGLLISQPQADEAELRRFYAHTFYEELWADPSDTANEAEYRQYEMAILKELWADWPPGPEAIEIGCGRGDMMRILRDEGFCVRGCEMGKNPIAHCRAQGLEVVEGAWPGLPFSRESCDLAISLQVIEHLSDPRAFVRELVERVRPGGVVAIATEDAWTSQTAFERALRRLRGRIPEFRSWSDHTFVLEPRHLRRLLEEAGCDDVRVRAFSRVPPVESAHWKLYKGFFRALDHGDFLIAVGRRA